MSFVARFKSDCENCESLVEPGQEARMIDHDKGLVAHVKCPEVTRLRPVCNRCWLVHGINQEECE